MSFSVLVVDDEPAALRYVCTIIEEHCPGFSVVGTALNGAEALAELERLRPELVVTDARMPVMDGIRMVNELREQHDETPVLILSGYDDFEYVRGALDTGVVDYILKPVSVQRLRKAMAGLKERLLERRDRAVARWLHKLGTGAAAECEVPLRHKCHVALLRYGGLVRRVDARAAEASFERHGELLAVAGRDGREALLFASSHAVDSPRFQSALRELAAAAPPLVTAAAATEPGSVATGSAAAGSRSAGSAPGSRAAAPYYTLAAFPRPVPAEEVEGAVAWLARVVDRSVKPGLTQHCSAEPPPEDSGGVKRALADRLSYGATTGSKAVIDEVVEDLVAGWERNAPSLYSLRKSIAALLFRCTEGEADSAEIDSLVDDAVEAPGSYADLGAAVKRVILTLLTPELLEEEGSDAPGFFRGIRSWVAEHYTEQLSLRDVAAHFGLSPSYVSRLFRRYEGISLGEYLTKRRVQVACELLAGRAETPVKEIAAYCGFRDQYYFSRVFKASTGYSPTEYRDSLSQE